jgi:hypothetical protein
MITDARDQVVEIGRFSATPLSSCCRTVPLQALFDSLEGGETLEEFLEGFPTVTREMAIAALEEAQQLLSGKS